MERPGLIAVGVTEVPYNLTFVLGCHGDQCVNVTIRDTPVGGYRRRWEHRVVLEVLSSPAPLPSLVFYVAADDF